MYIEEIIKNLPEELRQIKEKQDSILKLFEEKTSTSEALISSQEVLRRLKMKPKQSAWVAIRKKLITHYGMKRDTGIGYRITEKNFQKFLREEFQI